VAILQFPVVRRTVFNIAMIDSQLKRNNVDVGFFLSKRLKAAFLSPSDQDERALRGLTHMFIGVGDGGQGASAPSQKNSGKILFGQKSCKIRAFRYFFRAYRARQKSNPL